MLTTGNNRQHIRAYPARSFVGSKFLIRKLPDIRPIINNANPIERKYGP
jgi:hypothetical protein